jgi:hypothetical protein
LWPSSKRTSHGKADAPTCAERYAQELEGDFKYVLSNMSINVSRIEKDISLIVALVAIGGGSQSLQENRGISLLTRIAIIFLPFETVATVLQTQNGPNFWLLWAVALPLTVLVITITFLYRTASAKLSNLCAKYFQAKPKTAGKSSSGSQDEGIEMFQDPMHQSWSRSFV